MTESARATGHGRVSNLFRTRGRLLTLGTLVGTVAGMGSFMYIKESFMPWGVAPAWALVIIAIAGAYAHFFSEDLSDSITLSLVAVVVGLAVHTTAWIAPLWILDYPPAARDLLLPRMLGRALSSGILAYLLTFYAAYFTTLLVGGILDP